MTRRGSDYVERLRDGRQVLLDGEHVRDVTRHPGFRGSVASVAGLFDRVSAAGAGSPESELTFTSPRTGEPVSLAYLIPRSEGDLVRRRCALKQVAESTFGLLGRGPEHVAGFLAGFAGGYDVFARGGKEFAENLLRFYERARDEDLYVSYTIVPPQIDRSRPAHQQDDPHLYAGVKEERDGGVVIAGAQMLGTAAAISDYIFLSCITPLGPGDEAYAVSAAIPVGAPGVKVLSRRSYAKASPSMFDYPLSSQFDETDALVVFDDVFVPWDDVFVYRNREVLRAQWEETAGHILGNNQAQIRYWTKLEFLAGLAHRVAAMNGSTAAPAVKGALGDIAARAAMVAGLVYAQEQHHRIDEAGVAWPGPAECFAGMTLQSSMYPELVTRVRELCGGGVIQLPSSVDDYSNPEVAALLDRYVQSPGYPSVERVKLMKLMWDMIGSEFASRHLQYEMFYAGAPFLVKMRMYDAFDFAAAGQLVDAALAGYDLGGLRTPSPGA